MLYHKIETLFERDENTFKVNPEKLRDPIWSLIKEWEFTEKIDGTNVRIEYEFSPRSGSINFKGREEKSEIPKPLWDYLNEFDLMERCFGVFKDQQDKLLATNTDSFQFRVTIFGEGYGGKIQAGRQDKERGGKYSETEKFMVFDICVGDYYWLSRPNIEDICAKLRLDVVPLVGTMGLDQAVEMVKAGFKSKLGDGSIQAEGLIGRTPIPLFDAKHRRLICKIKTRDF